MMGLVSFKKKRHQRAPLHLQPPYHCEHTVRRGPFISQEENLHQNLTVLAL